MSILPNQEAVMGNAVPAQHPAVVLRSQLQIVEALLAAATFVVVGLAVAVVILASNVNVGGIGTASSANTLHHGGFNPAIGRSGSIPLPQQEHAVQSSIGSTRYDGGPEEGTRGSVQAPAPNSVDESLNGPGARTD
jgi:hypothetical protein